MLDFLVLILVIKVVAPLLHAYGMKWIEKHFDENEDQFAVLKHAVVVAVKKKPLRSADLKGFCVMQRTSCVCR